MSDHGFTHISASMQPHMVDVSHKKETVRSAKAQSLVILPSVIWNQLNNGEIKSVKGPVCQTAIIAGTMAVKETSRLIPFCHPLAIESCDITITPAENQTLSIVCTVSLTGKTGVEMEALTGASVAALTIYDMCKCFSHDIVISETKLLSKTGGKSSWPKPQ